VAHPRTQVHGFCTPSRQGDDVVVPVRVDGGLHGLAASPSIWRNLIGSLAELGILVAPAEAPLNHSSHHAPGANRREWVKPTAAGPAALKDLLAGKFNTCGEAALAHGMHPSAFSVWMVRHHGGKEYREIKRTLSEKRQAARDALAAAPVLKPSGRIL
jgi:hypothetical protein